MTFQINFSTSHLPKPLHIHPNPFPTHPMPSIPSKAFNTHTRLSTHPWPLTTTLGPPPQSQALLTHPRPSIPIPDFSYPPKPSRSIPGTPPYPSQPIHTHLRPSIPTIAFNTHLRTASLTERLLKPSQALHTYPRPYKPVPDLPAARGMVLSVYKHVESAN